MYKGGFGGGRDFEQKLAPVKVGEEMEVMIDAVGAKGDGIAKKEGFVIFVPNTSKGDTVKIKITKVLSNMAFAEAVGKGTGEGRSRERKPQEDYDVQAPEESEQPVDTENFGEES